MRFHGAGRPLEPDGAVVKLDQRCMHPAPHLGFHRPMHQALWQALHRMRTFPENIERYANRGQQQALRA